MAVDATVLPDQPAIDPAVRTGIPITLPPASPAAGGPRWLLPSVLVAGIVALVACLFVGGSASVAAVAGLPDAASLSITANVTGTRCGSPAALTVASLATRAEVNLARHCSIVIRIGLPPRVLRPGPSQ